MKAQPSQFDDASEDVKEMIRLSVMDTYKWFVGLVAERRGLSYEQALTLADGRVVTGRQALKMGLVDAIGSRKEVHAYLVENGISDALEIETWDDIDGDDFSSIFAGLGARLLGHVGLGALMDENGFQQRGLYSSAPYTN